MIKVSVVAITYRPGYIDNIVDSLLGQTMPKDQFELVLVDDICHLRKGLVRDYIGGAFSCQHLPSRLLSECSATASAVNTGLAVAQGELVLFLADYCYPHPKTLERHWEIYQQFGPKVIVSSRLVDDFVLNDQPQDYPAVLKVRVGDDDTWQVEWAPPVLVPMVTEIRTPNQENLISIWRERFLPRWPEKRLLDWRSIWTAQREVAPEVYENLPDNPRWNEIFTDRFDRWSWWWCGRGDSAPTALLRQVEGMSEVGQEIHGGSDGRLAAAMGALGAKYLIDVQAPVMILPHPFRKKEQHV